MAYLFLVRPMRALFVGAILTLAFTLRLVAQPIYTAGGSRFVLSMYHTYDDRHNVQLVSISSDKTVVIVLDGPTRFQARPGERFCTVSREHCANIRLLSADPRHQKAVLESYERHHGTTNQSRPNQAMKRIAARQKITFYD